MKRQPILLVVFFICFVTVINAQIRIYNQLGISGGISQFDIHTNNFITKKGHGFMGSLSTMADMPHKFYNVSFGMQLSENTLDISGRSSINSTEETFIAYKLLTVQLALLGHIKVIPNHVTIDLGPVLQYNSNLEFKNKDQEGYFINNYINLMAEQITKISRFNINGSIGASVGIKRLKLRAQYLYGVTNIFKTLEKENLDTTGGNSKFKGHQSMLVLGAIFFL